jgi:hypothetical protein
MIEGWHQQIGDACKAIGIRVSAANSTAKLRFAMKYETSYLGSDTHLSARYRPIALAAVKAAVSVVSVNKQGERKKELRDHFLLPENLPET